MANEFDALTQDVGIGGVRSRLGIRVLLCYILKNVKSVTVPNTNGLHGIASAIAVGVLGGDPTKELEVIAVIDVAEHKLKKAKEAPKFELDENGEFIQNGIVYNEMKETETSPTTIIRRYVRNKLFNGTYQYDITVPANTVAKVVLPGCIEEICQAGRYEF